MTWYCSAGCAPPALRGAVSIPRTLILALALALLAACSGGSSAPLSAAALTARIPHCASLPDAAPGPQMTSLAACMLPDGAQIQIAVFTTRAAENTWIASQGIYYGCCVQGDRWAATVDNPSQGGPSAADWRAVIASAGGRQVSNPA